MLSVAEATTGAVCTALVLLGADAHLSRQMGGTTCSHQRAQLSPALPWPLIRQDPWSAYHPQLGPINQGHLICRCNLWTGRHSSHLSTTCLLPRPIRSLRNPPYRTTNLNPLCTNLGLRRLFPLPTSSRPLSLSILSSNSRMPRSSLLTRTSKLSTSRFLFRLAMAALRMPMHATPHSSPNSRLAPLYRRSRNVPSMRRHSSRTPTSSSLTITNRTQPCSHNRGITTPSRTRRPACKASQRQRRPMFPRDLRHSPPATHRRARQAHRVGKAMPSHRTSSPRRSTAWSTTTSLPSYRQ